MSDTLKPSDFGLTEAQALAALYNNAKPLGMGRLHYTPRDMTEAEATELLESVKADPYFDYLRGRVMKVEIGPEIRPQLYDRDNGNGAAERALRQAQQAAIAQGMRP